MKFNGSKIFIRGLRILKALELAGPTGMSAHDIELETGIHRTTAYRFLNVLLNENIVKVVNRKFVHKYFLPGSTGSERVSLEVEMKKIIKKINQLTGDYVFLVTRDNENSLCLHSEPGSYPVSSLQVKPGYRQPLGVGAAGLALLACLQENEIKEILERNQEKYHGYKELGIRKLEMLIKSAKEKGWSATENAGLEGMIGVGISVKMPAGDCPDFAVSVSSSINRMSVQRQRIIASIIKTELCSIGLQCNFDF